MRSILALSLSLSGTLARVADAKYVFAHFMAQNSYSYSVSDWTNDITTAAGIGIDGFALNIAANDYEVPRIADAYTAASGTTFKFFLSFDMSYSWASADMVSIVAAHATSANTFKWNNNVLVSTYAGESYGDAFWAAFKSALSAQGITVTLAPAFTSYRDLTLASSLLSNFPSIDGFFNWWSWPADTNTNLTTATDLAYQSAHQSKNWPLHHVNDYAESHYIGDINPNVDLGTLAPNYVDGFDHSHWRVVAQYYISLYKNGVAPTVTDDQVVFWFRAHPKGVTCSTGTLPRNAAYPVDAVFAMAILSDSATITLDIGSNHYQWNASPGVSMGSVPFPVEDAQIPFIQIIKNGVVVKSGYGSTYVTNSCSHYNSNPWVGILSQ
ncbi:hypothetical protein FRB93_008062 [Tulasnella sp. JGI-2019a]|nr:hypothetical protein FRB93_008062 [Tulasnella sp. JGI-2019a]